MTDHAALLASLAEGDAVVVDGGIRGTVSEVIDVGGHRQLLVDTCGGGSGVELALFSEDGPRDAGIYLNHLDGEYRAVESIERIG